MRVRPPLPPSASRASAWLIAGISAVTLVFTPASAAETPDADPTEAPRLLELELVPTPAQAEGPYYPVELPQDRDADLTVVEGADAPADGDVLVLEGLLVSADGAPIEGATVEIWQTDAGGVYLHPGDPDFAQRDDRFQGYGESVTDAEGTWAFRTILPEVYGSRPRHIHAKVRIDGEEVLTTQVYFSGGDIPAAGAVELTGTELDALVVEAFEERGPDGAGALVARHPLVLP